MRHRLTLYTLLFLHHPLLYGQEHLVELSSTFREIPSFWLLHPVSRSQTNKNLHLDGRWSSHPLSPNLHDAGLRLSYNRSNQSLLLLSKATGFPEHLRYSPWKIIQHRARLTLSTHTGPDALLDYPYTISLPYGFPQAFSLGQVHLVNSLTIRWQRGIRIAILHNAKLNKENSLHRVHLQIELSLR